MNRMTWLLGAAVIAGAACFGGSGNGGGAGASQAAVAGALTSDVQFEGGTVKPGEIPATSKPGIALRQSGSPSPLVPGVANILPLGLDNPDEDTDPLTAVLMQFDGADDHVEVTTSASAGEVTIPYTVDAGVCDELCNETYQVTLAFAPVVESGGVGDHGSITITLDCTETGDPTKCAPSSGSTGSLPSDELATRYFEASNALTGAFCACQGLPVELCGSAAALGIDAACIGDAIDQSSGEVRNIIECNLAEMESLASCIATADCSDPATLPCDYDNRVTMLEAQCGAVPPSVEAQFDACIPTTTGPIVCASGSTSTGAYCDGTADCTDGSDEAGCTGFTCDGGNMVPASYQCDCYYDCADRTDEEGCACFLCTDGDIIPPEWACDGVPDCTDGIDENGCP